MSDEKRGELTLGQQRFLERMQEAQKEGVSLPDYYRAHGLSMAMLYKVRRQLVQKGIVPPTRPQLRAGRTSSCKCECRSRQPERSWRSAVRYAGCAIRAGG